MNPSDLEKKKILLTGANGFLGGKITKCLLRETDYTILAVAADKSRLDVMFSRENIQDFERIEFLPNDALLKGQSDLENVFCAVHLAFSRRNHPAADIAASLDLAEAVFSKLADAGVGRIINISSQSVYGNEKDYRTESMRPAPDTSYAMAKYAEEVLFNSHMKNTSAEYTSLRLDPVVQSQNVVKALCRHAREGHIQLRGGKQLFSFIDADDAARAVVSMIQSSLGWEHVYNVGWNRQRYTLVELADMVAHAAEEQEYGKPAIDLDENDDIGPWEGMDSSRFMKKTGWYPKIGIMDMVRSMIIEK